jgi:hypothetical protein
MTAAYLAVPSNGITTYHNGSTKVDEYSRRNRRAKPPSHELRDVIAWDTEGISLSGQHSPQHAVLFGCSAETQSPLTGHKLTTPAMLNYLIDVAERHPYAIHVGYAFKYDANMILAGLSERHLVKLWKEGRASFSFGDQFRWTVRWVPGKMLTITKRWGLKKNTRAKISVTIYDFFSFFGGSFIKTMEQILGDELTDDDREVIAHGKAERGKQTWNDMPAIKYYWQREIVLMQRTFEKFRDVMYRAGFKLEQWYGPGALANYINATNGIRPHLSGVQAKRTDSGTVYDSSFPPAAHEASKRAFSGGRFELFQAGRIRGPIYSIDINSAYPHALRHLPSFESGRWVHTVNPTTIDLFGFYRIQWQAPNAGPVQFQPQPLFWRDPRGMISYPSMAHGWYASPEAAGVQNMKGIEILEGWHWETTSEERPWSFLSEMYETRMRLGKKNLLSMPFKLGPNSLYGKYAQTVGWDQEKKLPPKSHALPVAAWVTSYCRAMLWGAVRQSPSSVVAVETDSVFMTTDPRTLRLSIGQELGQWSITEYDELIYMQNGMYHCKQDGEWKTVKSRGMNAREFPLEKMEEYLKGLVAGERWNCGPDCNSDCEHHGIRLETKPRFIGIGAALAMSAPLKSTHTSWRPQTKHMALGDTGKRVHFPGVCPQCKSGIPPTEQPHRLMVHSISDGTTLSYPRRLPWEQEHTAEVIEIRQQLDLEAELVERK